MSSRQHLRRCHVCGYVNQVKNGTVEKCEHCNKAFSKFYFFEESNVEGITENGGIKMRSWSESLRRSQDFQPIWGLTAFWENDH
jgi:hypothetical protein